MKYSIATRACILFAAGAMALLPAVGQHAGHDAAPATQSKKPVKPGAKSAPKPEPKDDHSHHATPAAPTNAQHDGHKAPTAPVADSHASHNMPAASDASALDLPVGREPAPAAVVLGAADAIYGASAMNKARGILAEEHGGAVLWKIMLDQAEYQTGPEGSGYGWDAEAWIGGDLNRLVIKTEGQGTEANGLEDAEWQALYSRAIGPYTDIQAGIRQDVGTNVATYAAFGVEALLPYWLKADAAVFISGRGDAFARLEGTYDLFLSQRFVLQPNLELNIAMQNVPSAQIASGVTDMTAGLRLRYDITRNFSPYAGVELVRAIGGTETLHRAAGEPVENTRFVLGIRTFF